jgi:hypothetical protein
MTCWLHFTISPWWQWWLLVQARMRWLGKYLYLRQMQ